MLVKDIAPGPDSSYPFLITAVGGRVFLRADDGVVGEELWVSDGTEAGTELVKDIQPGPDQSLPRELNAFGDQLLFVADDGVHGKELWKSDGTEAGTSIVLDIYPGSDGGWPEELTVVGETLFFFASDGVHGSELWKSDGTAEGTVMVADAVPGLPGLPAFKIVNVKGTLYLTTFDGLWRSDGTETGTWQVEEFARLEPAENAALDGTIVFVADDGFYGEEPWIHESALDTSELTVTKLGTGSGLITSVPEGIQCGFDCEATFHYGTAVSLVANPDPGSSFAGWGGDPECADGVVSMTNPWLCTATFELCTAPAEVVLEDQVISNTQEHEACNVLHVGPDLLITSTGDVTLRAGEVIYLYDGLTIESGAVVRFELGLEK